MRCSAKCSEVSPWIQLYLDGRLEGRRLPALARHLQTCDACRSDLSMYQSIVEGIGPGEPLRHPELLTRSIMRRIRRADAQARVPATRVAFSLGWADALLAATLATVLTLVFLVFEPALRSSVSAAITLAVVSVSHGVSLQASSWSPLVVWLIWIGLGVALTLWFAGREVREGWRRTLLARLPR